MKERISLIGFLILFLLCIRLFMGVYSHDEFGGTHPFFKHRPVWKWRFYSPIGLSDLTKEDLSPESRKEQAYFDEFVSGRGLSR